MTVDRYAEDRIRSWLLSIAPDRLPDHVLPATFERTRRLAQTSRRPRWASISMRSLPIVVATSALAVVVVVFSGAFGRLGDQLIQRFLPISGLNRPLGTQFGATAQITGQWTSSSDIAFSVQFSSPETEPLYWRAAVYDEYDLTSWRQTITAGFDVAPGDDVLSNTADAITEAGRRAVTFRVFPDEFRASTILSPQALSHVDTTVRVSYVDEARFVANVDRNGGAPYTVTALVRERGDDGASGISVNKLRAAGTAYPPAITERYLQVPAGAIPPGGDAERLLEDILAEVPDPKNPYDVASTMVDYLRSSANFRYDTDVRDLACEGLSVVECFARFRHGYCQYYATTMAILLREHGIPTRLAAGFLPGKRDARLFETVSVSAAHAWVEVYFPDYGWVEFDPTGGGIAAAEPLPTGEPGLSGRGDSVVQGMVPRNVTLYGRRATAASTGPTSPAT
jgi:transglutaminase-like putative cysteine protease